MHSSYEIHSFQKQNLLVNQLYQNQGEYAIEILIYAALIAAKLEFQLLFVAPTYIRFAHSCKINLQLLVSSKLKKN